MQLSPRSMLPPPEVIVSGAFGSQASFCVSPRIEFETVTSAPPESVEPAFARLVLNVQLFSVAWFSAPRSSAPPASLALLPVSVPLVSVKVGCALSIAGSETAPPFRPAELSEIVEFSRSSSARRCCR